MTWRVEGERLPSFELTCLGERQQKIQSARKSARIPSSNLFIFYFFESISVYPGVQNHLALLVCMTFAAVIVCAVMRQARPDSAEEDPRLAPKTRLSTHKITDERGDWRYMAPYSEEQMHFYFHFTLILPRPLNDAHHNSDSNVPLSTFRTTPPFPDFRALKFSNIRLASKSSPFTPIPLLFRLSCFILSM